jgi:hypothetical protein
VAAPTPIRKPGRPKKADAAPAPASEAPASDPAPVAETNPPASAPVAEANPPASVPVAAKNPPVSAMNPPVSAPTAPLPPAWADAELPASLAAPAGFTLLLDVAPVKGMAFSNIEDVLAGARNKVEAEAKCSYRLIDYGKGPAFLAEQLEEDFRAEPPRGAFFASSYGLDKEVLDVLMRHATVVFRATR